MKENSALPTMTEVAHSIVRKRHDENSGRTSPTPHRSLFGSVQDSSPFLTIRSVKVTGFQRGAQLAPSRLPLRPLAQGGVTRS